MLRRLREGSIRWQIVTLAVLPILLVGVLGVMTEPPSPEDTEFSRAEVVAAQIALVADQVENAATPEIADALLSTTRMSGLAVQRVDPFVEQSTDGTAFLERLLFALSNIHGRSAWAIAGPGSDPKIVVEVRGGLLAFSPAVVAVPGMNDNITNILLSVIIIVLPVTLLSIYAARLLSDPLLRIAAVAEAHQDSGKLGAVFDETGPLEIRQLARRLNGMRAQINNMLAERTAMLRAVSHDLRTPLTRLKLRIERSVPVETAGILLRDITTINEMIDETLTYLRNDTETEAPRKTDLPSLLRTISTDFSDVGFAVSYDGPDRLSFVCRSRALSRAVSNLVDNGTKHGDSVRLALAALPDGAVRIEVSDNGPGIAEPLRTKVLEPFVKGDASRTPASRSGFGLGLSIVREVVRSHGGTMELKPRKPNGLIVALALPAHDRVAKAPLDKLDDTPKLARK